MEVVKLLSLFHGFAIAVATKSTIFSAVQGSGTRAAGPILAHLPISSVNECGIRCSDTESCLGFNLDSPDSLCELTGREIVISRKQSSWTYYESETLTTLCPHRHSGRCYLLVLDPKTWDNAAEFCEMWHPGGHLVDITSAEENSFIKEVIDKTDRWFGVVFWTSGRRPIGGAMHELYWNNSGDVLGFTNWDTGSDQPNNLGSQQNCIGFHTVSGLWYDERCTKPYSFVCEV